MSYRDGADIRIYEYDSSLVAGWNPKVSYCFQETKTSPSQRYRLHLPDYVFSVCLFSSFWNLSGYSNGFRTSAWGRSDNTDLLPSLLGLSVKIIFYQEYFLQMFDPKGHVALERPSSSFPGYLTLSSLLSARDRQQPLIQFSQQPAISIWHYSNICSVTMTNTCSGTVAHTDERKHCDSRASVLSERSQNTQQYK